MGKKVKTVDDKVFEVLVSKRDLAKWFAAEHAADFVEELSLTKCRAMLEHGMRGATDQNLSRIVYRIKKAGLRDKAIEEGLLHKV